MSLNRVRFAVGIVVSALCAMSLACTANTIGGGASPTSLPSELGKYRDPNLDVALLAVADLPDGLAIADSQDETGDPLFQESLCQQPLAEVLPGVSISSLRVLRNWDGSLQFRQILHRFATTEQAQHAYEEVLTGLSCERVELTKAGNHLVGALSVSRAESLGVRLSIISFEGTVAGQRVRVQTAVGVWQDQMLFLERLDGGVLVSDLRDWVDPAVAKLKLASPEPID